MKALLCYLAMTAAASAEVALVRTPHEGLQPQAAVDKAGRIHVVYFKGPARAGDLFYVWKDARGEFSQPSRVNSNATNAIAVGTIRGAQMTLGKNGRVHVAWNSADLRQMLYTRLNDAGTAFEPERNLLTWTGGLDGGGSVAADETGNVYVTWHGSAPDNNQGEAGRAVFVAQSHDDGKTFRKEAHANPVATGACGCCGMKAMANGREVHVLYRAATKITGRDMTLLISTNRGQDFQQRVVSKWNLASCPMSSAALLGGELAAWEMDRQVGFARVRDFAVTTPPGSGKRKHPSLAQNASGTVLLAWAENTGWQKGGSLAWQLFKDGKPIGDQRQAEGVPVWSMPAAVAVGEKFYIIY